jgi:arylformamidase
MSSASMSAEPPDPRLNWRSLSQDERDAAYDNNGAVKNSAELIAERNRLSAEARAATNAALLDLPYGGKDRTKIDLYPAAESAAPCLVFLHGGYWLRNSRELFAMIVRGFAAHGWSVAIPGYTLAPEATLTAIAGEIRLALDWLASNGPAYGLNGRTIVAGWSAGAQLAALALDHPLAVGGIAMSGVYDLAPLRETSMNATLSITDQEAVNLSPLKRPAVHKPMTIAYGAAELPIFVHDARNFHRLRVEAGAPSELIAIEGADHFTILEQLCDPDGALVAAARALIAGAQ